TPVQVELWTTQNGVKMLKKLEDNKSVSTRIEEHVYAPRELFSFTTSDGQKLDGYLIKPVNFDPEKEYPLILNIYGGPGAQGVYNQFESSGWIQYLAQEGYVIANVNNRGSGGYGRDFEKIVYRNLGEWEAHDFAETALNLAENPWVDGKRMAIRGHSYGGYMASLTMVLHPDVFKAGIAGAPVSDWRLYDTIYTERYMGLLEDNEEGYINSSVMAHADQLEGYLFVAHSSMDENVHVQNTMQMMTAFINAGKDVDLRIYPPGAHGVAFNFPSFVLLHESYTHFLNRHLKN
ncbi:MAG: alpha/beta hydrolase family protein, partial [Balneolaceae bacterium]